MEIKHKDSGTEGQFYLEDASGISVAKMTYHCKEPDHLIIDHTEVDSSLKGQGIGYRLIDSLVVFAREKNFSVTPLCSYAQAVFKKKTEYKDILKQ
ncbi:GNAT family N-acetyltransferase [Formosa haliotis]|uniref:GNAT family N-acetyltransferase n=1 Tax=Formosa haliotis TaxID=1555194 RepID=UPI0008269ED9|nr:GNAT family N-acetyltransferase [Formosa haliotis]